MRNMILYRNFLRPIRMALRVATLPESVAVQGFAGIVTGPQPGRPEIFFEKMDRSVQIREAGQAPFFRDIRRNQY